MGLLGSSCRVQCGGDVQASGQAPQPDAAYPSNPYDAAR